jgi:hypothetical protein
MSVVITGTAQQAASGTLLHRSVKSVRVLSQVSSEIERTGALARLRTTALSGRPLDDLKYAERYLVVVRGWWSRR